MIDLIGRSASIKHDNKICRNQSSYHRDSRKDGSYLIERLLEVPIARILSNDKIILLQHKKRILENLGRTGVKVTRDHLSVNLTHHHNLIAVRVNIHITRKSQSL